MSGQSNNVLAILPKGDLGCTAVVPVVYNSRAIQASDLKEGPYKLTKLARQNSNDGLT